MVSAMPAMQHSLKKDWISIDFPENPLTIDRSAFTKVVVMLKMNIKSDVTFVDTDESVPMDPDWIKLATAIFLQKTEDLKQLLKDENITKKKANLLRKKFSWAFTKSTDLNDRNFESIKMEAYFRFNTSLVAISVLRKQKDMVSLLMDHMPYDFVNLFPYKDLYKGYKATFSELQEYMITRLFINVIYTKDEIPLCKFIIVLKELEYVSLSNKLKEQFEKTREKYMQEIDSVITVKAVSQIAVDYLLGAADITTLANNKLRALIGQAIREGMTQPIIYRRLQELSLK